MADIIKGEVPKAGPNIHFFNTEHTADKIEEAWDEAKNADVILLEFITEAEFRNRLENYINFASGSDDPQIKQKAIEGINQSIDSAFFNELAKRIINSGKEIYLIDVNQGEPSHIEANEGLAYAKKSVEQFADGDFEESFENYKEFIKHMASSSWDREGITAHEVQDILEQNRAIWNGKNILVMQGGVHTRTYHMIKAAYPDMNIDRSFLSKDYVYPANFQLMRKLIFGKSVSDDDYKRGYLAYNLIGDALFDFRGDQMTDGEVLRESGRIAAKMTSAELSECWQELRRGTLNIKGLIDKYSPSLNKINNVL